MRVTPRVLPARPGKSEALVNVATKFLVGANIGWPPTLRGPGGDNVDNAVIRRAETADEHTKSSVEETFFEKQKWLFAARTSHAPKNGQNGGFDSLDGKANSGVISKWWAHQGSNLGPAD